MSKYIYINSSHGTGNPTNFTIVKTYNNLRFVPSKVTLVSATIPYLWDNITSSNNKLTLSVGGIDYDLTIPAGHYNANTLKTMLQSILNNTYNGFTVTYDETTFKYTISHATDIFVLSFKSLDSIGYVLGFGMEIVGGQTVTSIYVVNFKPDLEVFIVSNLVSGADNGIIPWFPNTDPNYGILASVPVNGCYGSLLNYSGNATLPCNSALFQSYRIELTFGLKLLSTQNISLQNTNWSAVLKFEP